MKNEFKVRYRGRVYDNCILKSNGVVEITMQDGSVTVTGGDRCEVIFETKKENNVIGTRGEVECTSCNAKLDLDEYTLIKVENGCIEMDFTCNVCEATFILYIEMKKSYTDECDEGNKSILSSLFRDMADDMKIREYQENK